MEKKYKVVFAFVEAGMGHIMPMTAVCEAFEKKYKDKCEIIKVKFFQDKHDPKMKYVEDEFIREVKLHNKFKFRGTLQFMLMKLFGTKISMKFLMEHKYGRAFLNSIQYLKELSPDLIVNTHFSTLYYACEAREKGYIDSSILAYCPDPVIGRQWDLRTDMIGLSSLIGEKEAIESGRFERNQIKVIPFLIRNQVKEYNKGRQFYRKELGIPENNFTVLLADGAYGAGKLKKTVNRLLKSEKKLTVIAVCGKNEKLYRQLIALKAPKNIYFVVYGFIDKMLMLSASCDLFVGKAGASNIAEPAYFGAPAIITFRATPIEKWICDHYVKHVGSALLEENINKAVKLIEKFADNPECMKKYVNACITQMRCDGPEIYADTIWESLNSLNRKGIVNYENRPLEINAKYV